MATTNLNEVRDYLVSVAQECGEIILNAKPSSLDNTAKRNSADIVTETDQAVESLIALRLREKYPDFHFIGEETYTPGTRITTDPTFIVDPIDGTSNFVHGFPDVCTSIGLVIDRVPTVGVVYLPFTEELFTAIKGQGAFLQRGDRPAQRLPLYSSPLGGLGPACIGIEWGVDREGVNFDMKVKLFTTLARTKATGGCFVNSIRCTGSFAITTCRVAAAQEDLFWDCGSWVWDVAAAWCIMNEAGGRIVDGHPGIWFPQLDSRRYLAVRPATGGQEEIIEQFWAVIGNDRSTYGPP